MLFDFLKSMAFKIKLNPAQTISRIKANTQTDNRLGSGIGKFDGYFLKNYSFVVHMAYSGNIAVKDYHPRFSGCAKECDGGTELTLKMKSNPLIAIVFLCLYVGAIAALITGGCSPQMITILLIVIGFSLVTAAFFHAKYNNMKITLEEIFQDVL